MDWRNNKWDCSSEQKKSWKIDSENKKLENFVENLKRNAKDKYNNNLKTLLKEFKAKFVEQMDDDFNCPNALTEIYTFVKKANEEIANNNYNAKNVEEIIEFFKKIDSVFKVFDFLYEKEQKMTDVDEKKIKKLIDERNKFRAEKNYAKADEIKKEIISLGVELTDNKDGTTSYKII